VRQFVLAQQWAGARHAQMRFVIPDRKLLRVLQVTGLDRLLSISPNLDAAASVGPARDRPQRPGNHVLGLLRWAVLPTGAGAPSVAVADGTPATSFNPGDRRVKGSVQQPRRDQRSVVAAADVSMM
jgi:hypothetical protein